MKLTFRMNMDHLHTYEIPRGTSFILQGRIYIRLGFNDRIGPGKRAAGNILSTS